MDTFKKISSHRSHKNLNKNNKFFSSSIKEHKKYKLKIKRKILHLMNSFIGFILIFFPQLDFSIKILIYILTLITFILDSFRIIFPVFNHWLYQHLKNLLLPRDFRRYTSGTFYLLGISFILAVTPVFIAGISIIILAFSDTFASIFGIYLKKYFPYQLPYSHKSYIGLLGFIFPTIIIIFFLGVPLYKGLLVLFLTGLAEVYVTIIDDNLVIPVISGLLLLSIL